MKAISSILVVSLLFLSCSNTHDIVGQWRCDNTGTMVGQDSDRAAVTLPIDQFYSELGVVEPFLMRFSENGEYDIDGGDSGPNFKYYLDYNNDSNQVLIRDDSDHSEDFIMTISSLTSDHLVASFNIVEDECVLHLRMDRED